MYLGMSQAHSQSAETDSPDSNDPLFDEDEIIVPLDFDIKEMVEEIYDERESGPGPHSYSPAGFGDEG